MGRSVEELRRRAIEGVEAEVRAFATGYDTARLIEREGLVAGVSPATPDRSLPNAVYYSDPTALAGALDELAGEYEAAGVAAWTVWVPDDDRDTAALLSGRGHVLDASPRAMALWLENLGDGPPQPDGVERAGAGQGAAADLNDRAYGYETRPFAKLLERETAPPLQWAFAALGGNPIACCAVLEQGDDAVVTLVATDPGHRGLGIAGWLLRSVLADARERGMASASLQATKLGAGVYERLGFRDLGGIEMWERRAASEGPAVSPS